MFGAIIGDIAGSAYERLPHLGLSRLESKDFNLFPQKARFTDDTVLTVAVAEALMDSTDFKSRFKKYVRMEPKRGYGQRFAEWAISPTGVPYNSFGNGSAMRVSPVAWYLDDLEEVESMATESAECTHNHPEGIKGAVVTAACILLARQGQGKEAIRNYAIDAGYDMNRTVQSIRESGYTFDVTCQGSVPEAIIAFLESGSYEDAIRNAIFLGGDADTQGAITGSIAEAFYGGVPSELKKKAQEFLTGPIQKVADEFDTEYVQPKLGQ